MTSNWKECKLGDLCKIKGGKRLPVGKNLTTKPNTHPYIRVRDLTNIKTLNLTPDFEYVDDEVQKTISRYIVNTGDVIISIVGTIGLISIIGPTLDNANLTENCAKLIDLKGIDNHFLYYYLISNEGQQEIKRNSVGAVQAKLPLYGIGDIRINLPPLETQQKIAKVLSAIDDKIELNNSINNNLEQQAMALFKSWFIDFEPFDGTMPEGWITGHLSDLADVKSGKRPNKKSTDKTIEMNIPIVGAASIMGYTNEYLYNEKILVTGRVGTHGVIQKFCTPCWTSDNTLVILTKYYEFIYQVLKTVDFQNMNRGSTQPLITQTDLKNIEIIIPGNDILENFEVKIDSLMKLQNNLLAENEQLSALRDTLLPKLMSGEIDVDKVEV